MFQSFEVTARPEDGPARLALLRAEMARERLDGFLVPRADAHQGEYVADCDARLSWLTGFTGSAGFCAVLKDRAGVFVDGRYRTQVKSQVDLAHFTPVDWPEVRLGEWLREAMPEGGTIAYDPWLHSYEEIEKLLDALAGSGITLCDYDTNCIDIIWKTRPAAPVGQVLVYPIGFAGVCHKDKLASIASELQTAGVEAAILTLPDSINWLLNIRGSDISRNPIAQCNAILYGDAKVDLFINEQKLSPELITHLGAQVRIFPPDKFIESIGGLHGKVLLDEGTVPMAVVSMLEIIEKAEPVFAQDPCILPKARKNPVEIAGARAAHLRDGVAMVEFLCWLDEEAPKGNLHEVDVVKKLEGFRRASNALRDISFETICGAGPNAAIMHYRVNEDSNRAINTGEMLLVDSGGQYLDGTTDITRTVAIGEVGGEEKSCFTRVLQGMIAISRARFPKGLAGRDLDPLARYPLWLAGQDYNHGTGHGVGAYLSVHEGPQRISKISEVPLEAGMMLSNEPGYYREGAFGIRIENLIVVENAPALSGADARDMLAFETLTYVPIDRRLIVTEMLSTKEREWLNAYHAKTLDMLKPLVKGEALDWLTSACAPL